MISRPLCALTLVLFAGTSAALAGPLPMTFSTVALTGQPAPDAPGYLLTGFSGGSNFPVINDAGQVGFTFFARANIDNSFQGVFSGMPGAIGMVTRTGIVAPNGPAGAVPAVFAGFDVLNMNDAGRMTFRGFMRAGATPVGDGFWTDIPGPLHAPDQTTYLFRGGAPADAFGPGVVFDSTDFPSINVLGQFATRPVLFDPAHPGSNTGILSGTPTAQVAVAQTGMNAPGLPAGYTYAGTGFFATINASGQVAYAASTSQVPNPPSYHSVLYSGPINNPQPRLQTGDAATGIAGMHFTFFADAMLNNAGQIAFNGGIDGPGVVAGQNDRVIYRLDAGGASFLARTGEQCPGLPAGTFFQTFRQQPAINANGVVAFACNLTGPAVTSDTAYAMYVGQPGDLHLVARAGDTPPGVNPGATYFALQSSPAINALGQVAFLVSLTGAGVDQTNHDAIFATTPDGVLHLVVREGQLFQVAPGDFRTIANLGATLYSGDESGMARGFNDAGQLVFSATFTDGTAGVFITTIVPAPGACALAALGLLAMSRRRSR